MRYTIIPTEYGNECQSYQYQLKGVEGQVTSKVRMLTASIISNTSVRVLTVKECMTLRIAKHERDTPTIKRGFNIVSQLELVAVEQVTFPSLYRRITIFQHAFRCRVDCAHALLQDCCP